jgi:hypothetical protein
MALVEKNTEAPHDPAAGARLRGNARTRSQRALRDERILERVRGGWLYEDIAKEEHLSLHRLRAIVSHAIKQRQADPSGEHAHLQRTRLAPALRLAAEAIAAGDLRAIDRMLRLLDRLDRYNGAVASERKSNDETYRKLKKALDRAARPHEEAQREKERHHSNALARLAALGVDEITAVSDLPGEDASGDSSGVAGAAAPAPRGDPEPAWKNWLALD